MKYFSDYSEEWERSVLKKRKNKGLEKAYEYMTRDVDGRGRMSLFGLSEEQVGVYDAEAEEEEEEEEKTTRKRTAAGGGGARKKSAMMQEIDENTGMPNIMVTMARDVLEKDLEAAVTEIKSLMDSNQFIATVTLIVK